MIFTTTTNHKTALQIKKCFESKVLAFEAEKGMKLLSIDAENGYARVEIECKPSTKTSSIFFLGMYAQSIAVECDFNRYDNLPREVAQELLLIK